MPSLCYPIQPLFCPSNKTSMSFAPLPAPSSSNYSFNKPFNCQTISSRQNPLDPSSYRVTVRQITPPHIATAAAEAYRARRNKIARGVLPEEFKQPVISQHQHAKPTHLTKLHKQDHVNSNDQYIPSVPSKKIVLKNDGTRASSTSFVTTFQDQVILSEIHYFFREFSHIRKVPIVQLIQSRIRNNL